MSAAVLTLAACQSNDKLESTMNFSETEKSVIDKGMENQPESSYWFPEDLLAWDFSSDPDAAFNVSSVPLAKRVEKSTLKKSNATQNDEMKVVALSIMNSSTSGNSPRGLNNFDANVFSNWQYIDQLVYWGGSSGEGIIVPPSADVIDAAHKNGVPVLGTVFFPQTAHGGKLEWLDQFLEKDTDGHFPMVDKLLEVAEIYGFDGWFINQETDTEVTSFDEVAEGKTTKEAETKEGLSKKHAELMLEFIAEYQAEKADGIEVMWYDSMTTDGKMDWQNALTDENAAYMVDTEMEPLADSMFLNFWWTTDRLADQELLKASKEKAEELGVNPYDLYAGIDVQENGYMTPVKWDLFTDDQGKAFTSLGLYVPSWTHASSSNPDTFQEKEQMFWVNAKGNPKLGELSKNNEWPGISTFAVEQTAITSLPFTTNFSLGNGYNYFIEGEKVSSRNWHNRSLQDIMPTYRWDFEHGEGNEMSALMDYADAYNGGNSLKFRGKLQADTPSIVNLYATQFKLAVDTQVSTTAKASSETALNLILTFADGTKETFKGDLAVGEEWTKVTYDVKKAVDKEVTAISYEFSTKEDISGYDLRLGQLAFLPKTEKNAMSVTDVALLDAIFDEEESNYAGIRMAWEANPTATFSHFEIYRVNQDKTRSFIGATPVTNFYINGLARNDDTNQTNFEIVAVDIFGQRGEASKEVTLEWPDNSVPKTAFVASKTIIAPGETVTFQNQSSENTEKLEWTFEGGDITTSTEETPKVAFADEGSYKVSLKATNTSGETVLEKEGFITVKKGVNELANLTKGATASATSYVNDGEAPEFAIDEDLSKKWCAVGTPPHAITLDLGSVQTVGEVYIAHAEAGGEGANMNTRAYSIEVSEDGKDFKQVVRVINNAAAETVDTFAAENARFVRLTIDKPTQESDSAARIYEIGVYGLKELLK